MTEGVTKYQADLAIARTQKKVAAQYLRREVDKITEHTANYLLPRPYVVLSRTLQDRLDRYADVESQQISLREELGLHRAAAQDAIDTFGQALDLREAYRKSPTKSDELSRRLEDAVTSTASSMRDVLRSVQACAVDAARVEIVSKGHFTLPAVRAIISQVARLMHEVCGEEHVDLAVELERRLMSDIRVAVIEEGTLLTPDMDVSDMDSMVPLI